MQALREFTIKCCVHHAVPGDTVLAHEAVGNDKHAVMRLAARRCPGVARVLGAVVTDLQQTRRESGGDQGTDAVGSARLV